MPVKSLLRALPVCAILAAAAFVVHLAINQINAKASAASVQAGTGTVTAADGVVQTMVSGSGNVEPGIDEDVNFATSGTLKTIAVHTGEDVTKGQTLGTLDRRSAGLTLDEAELNLTAARSELATAEDATPTSSSSSSTGATSTNGSTATSTATTIDSDELTVKGDEQTVSADKLALAETTLRSPVNGTIASLETISPGDSVTGSSSTAAADASSGAGSGTSTSSSSSASSDTSSSTFAEIVNERTLTMAVPFSESDVGEIRIGQIATVTISALTGVELGARVTAISATGSESDSVVSYDVTLKIDQTNAQVLPGMSATATVVVDQAQGVTVPTDAVTGTGSEGTVTLVENGKDVTRQVIVGTRGTDRAVIVSGVKAGQELLVTRTGGGAP